jgi:hypothetical protein
MPTLQRCVSAAARAVADVPSAIAAAKHTAAQATSKRAIMRLTNFIFISLLSFYLSYIVFLTLSDFSSLRSGSGQIRLATASVEKITAVSQDNSPQP